MALAGDVGGDLDPAGQLDARDLAKRRVRLLRGGGVHAGAHAAALRAALEGRGLDLGDLVAATLADQLLDGWHLPAFSVFVRSALLFYVVLKSLYCSFALSAYPATGRVARARTDKSMRSDVGHANWPGVRALWLSAAACAPVGQARATTIPGRPQRNKTVRQTAYRRSAYAPDRRSHATERCSMPAASRSTMSENTASVSMSSITPVISSSTKPCIADQNSSAA